LRFTIPGPFVSGNHAHYRTGARTRAARDYQSKVSLLCLDAKRKQKWTPPPYVVVYLGAYNVPYDCDNLAKVTNDGMERIAYKADSRILSLLINRFKDNGPPRIEVVVSAADRTWRGFPKAR
jgi:Holliday junction resolvase RusA-like endonuclease